MKIKLPDTPVSQTEQDSDNVKELRDKSEDDASKIVYLGPTGRQLIHVVSEGEEHVSLEYMVARSLEMLAVLNGEAIQEVDLEKFQGMVVYPGDLLAYEAKEDFPGEHSEQLRVKKCATDPERQCQLEPGNYVRLTSRGEYRAGRYGFVSLENDTLSILAPIRVDREMVKVNWLVPAKHPIGLEQQMLELWLADNNVLVESAENLKQLIDSANTNNLETGVYTIASGEVPVQGKDGYIEWLINVEKASGKEDSQGRIDFRERNYVINVDKNQLVARLVPPTAGIAGLDLAGQEMPVVDGTPVKLTAGEKIVTQKVEGEPHLNYISSIDGVLHYNGDTISVAKVLVLSGGVNFETGNIDFSGDVVVMGQVTAGFSVKATGDITIHDTVERGCRILAQGDITVTKGIVGDQTFVKAGGALSAQNVHEATLQAEQGIVLENYAFHAKLWSCSFIQIKKGHGKQGGSIMGGEAWATDGIDAYVAGSPSWGETKLTAGILPEKLENLVSLNKGIEAKNAQSKQLLDFFGITNVDLDKIRILISKADGMKRKSLALRAKYLGNVGKDLQELLIEKKEVIESIEPPPENVEIRIRQKAFPNVAIGLGGQQRVLDSECGATRFKTDAGRVSDGSKGSLSDILNRRKDR